MKGEIELDCIEILVGSQCAVNCFIFRVYPLISNEILIDCPLPFNCRLSSVVNDCPTAASSPILRVTANNSSGSGGGGGGGGGSNRRSSPVSFLSSISSSISNSSGQAAVVGSGGLTGGSPAGGGGVGVAAAMTTQ